ncbi:glycosyltransferase family 2 protein [Lacibacterium aquatile]|uniref:Glycosyltransferase family 2 protein n=1 Tax=Lacibacterium aquatile TaxID=1168082 RepID=A0ABW5DVB3_9PROT
MRFETLGHSSAASVKAAEILLRDGLITPPNLDEALGEQERWGSNVGQILIARGHTTAFRYYKALAEALDLPFVNLRETPPDDDLPDAGERQTYLDLALIPWRRGEDGSVTIATMDVNEDVETWAVGRFGQGGYRFAITSKFDVLWEVQKRFEALDDLDAREGLWRVMPMHSARATFVSGQVIAVWVILSLLILGLWWAPKATLIGVSAFVSLLYLATFCFKFLLTWLGGNHRIDVQVTVEEVAALSDADLPVYTLLIPMYKEHEVLPLLVDSVRKLDYPKSKLDVKLVLEAGDHETIEAAKALGAASIFEIVRVPHSQPKTKPKACNYALRFARGQYLCIYDAEDMPEPDQLKKAVVAFRKADPNVACIQARLNYFNRDDNLLTRMFTLEYSQWFDFLLPGLDALRVPIPLGGTSNHFKIDVLRGLGAWDSFNVTEDADLGVRMTQEGYRVGIVNSTTFEEANGVYPSWIKQRSRWIKGYMQTWLVHMRNPIKLYKSLGHTGFWGFQFFIGGPPLTVLLNPILWLTFIVTLIWPMPAISEYFPPVVLYISLFNLLVANLLYIYFGVVAAFKRQYYDLVPYGLLQPFYWIMHSIAAYKALSQLIFNPHYWEKTQHGTSSATHQALAKAAEAKNG